MPDDKPVSKCLKCGAPTTTSASWGYCAQCLIAGLFSTSGSHSAKPDVPIEEGRSGSPDRSNARDPSFFGNYELLSEIARGGMGVVYKARQKKVQRVVALKMVLGGKFASDADVKRFRIETEAVTNLDHPNIVPIYEVGDVEGRPYFTMKLIEGGNLARHIERLHQDQRTGAKLIATVARAVHHAHQRGVLHRDLKPANILLDDKNEPFITDFGLARSIENDSDLTITGTILGTPNFMAPEQAAGAARSVSTAADIYSLGAILYFILTNRPPFGAATPLETLRLVQESALQRPSTVHLKTDRDLETICLKCLEKEPGRRYGSALALAEDLERWLRHDNILARRSTPAERAIKWVKRKPVIAGLASAILLLLLTVAIGSPIAIFRIDRERKRVLEEAGRTEEQRKIAVAKGAEALSQLYTTRISTAQQEWEQSRFPLLSQLIEQTASDRDRGFEWYFWRRQIQQAMAVLRGHLWTVTAVAFSPDGTRIATGSDDQWCVVWDAADFRELAILKNHRASVRTIAWSLDSQRIITGSDDHWIRVWNASDGKELASTYNPRGRVGSVAIAPDGQRIVSGNQDGTATIWELPSHHGPGRSRREEAHSISREDSQSLLTSAPTIQVSTTVAKQLEDLREQKTFERHTGPVFSAQFSFDGQWLVTGSADGTCKIWNVSDGKLVRTLEGHASYVRSVAFSSDGKWILSGSEDNTARLWQVSSGQLLRVFPHGDWVRSAQFSPDGRRIATAGDDGAARLWQAEDGRELTTLRMHEDQIRGLAFSPDGTKLITGARDHLAKVWKVDAKLDVLDLNGSQGAARFVQFSPDGKLAVTLNDDYGTRLWNASDGRLLAVGSRMEGMVRAGAFSSDGHRVVTITTSGRIRALGSSGEVNDLATVASGGTVWSAAFSPDTRRVVAGGPRGEVIVWEVATGRQMLALKSHGGLVRAAAFSPNGRWIATGGNDMTVQIWNAETGQLTRTLQAHAGIVWSIAFSSDSKRLVTAGGDRKIKVWDTERGTELLTLHGHGNSVSSARLSPDDSRILSASEDGTVKLWHALNGTSVLTLQAEPRQPMFDAAFSTDGLRIIAGGGNGTIRIWDAASTKQVAVWENEDKRREEHLARVTKDRLAALEQRRATRAASPGTLRQWLLLAPISLSEGKATPAVLDEEIVANEKQLRPRAGDRVSVGQAEFTWQSVQLTDLVMDLTRVLDRAAEYSAGYAVSYIEAEQDQSGLRLLVGTDDFVKIFLNGREIHQSRLRRGYVEDEDVIEGVELKAGTNVLVVKLVNVTSDWMAAARFTDGAGNSVKGIKTGLAK